MAAIHDTAYPRLASSLSSAELKRLYSITRKEKTWIEKQRITQTSLLDTVVYLKVFQCLGYFPPPNGIHLTKKAIHLKKRFCSAKIIVDIFQITIDAFAATLFAGLGAFHLPIGFLEQRA